MTASAPAPSAHAVEDAVEASHWWFVVRRRLLDRLIAGLGVDAAAPVLDVGSGTGSNLRMLSESGFRNVRGVDDSEEAVRLCRGKGLGPVERADARALPFADASFDLVLATDVIEHVEDDIGALREIRRVLRPGGRAIVTVPAFMALWGHQDDVSGHRRRYRRPQLLSILGAAGLAVLDCHYFNYLLFVPIWLARRVLRLVRWQGDSENTLNTPALNALLTRVFDLDVRTAGRLRPPFGVSLLAVVARRAE